MRLLRDLLQHIGRYTIASGELEPDLAATSLTDDSREVERGGVFVALKGAQSDGHLFIQAAAAAGAKLIIAQQDGFTPQMTKEIHTCVVLVEDTHLVMGELAAAWYDYPGKDLKMVGITGTNGKTTCTWLLEGVLREAGYVPGVIGTINYRFTEKDEVHILQEAPLTTPDPLTLQKTLRAMADGGVTHVVMEVSSHALAQKRLGGIQFDVAAFTNLSRDHLDYHPSMEDYFAAKKSLFHQYLKSEGCGVMVTEPDADGRNWGEELAGSVEESTVLYRCGLDAGKDIYVTGTIQDENGTTCTLHIASDQQHLVSPLTGQFNVLNMLTVVGVAEALHIPVQATIAALAALDRVPGRLERVLLDRHNPGNQPTIFVDYAHTPDALENVLKTVQPLCPARLICVFGCGGDRDRGKRPEMGEVAGRFADIAIVTSDNPRTENPEQIIEDILPGLLSSGAEQVKPELVFAGSGQKNIFCVTLNRAAAIDLACSQAQQQDWIVIAGKGHENYQIIGREKQFFDDRIHVLDALAKWSDRRLVAATSGKVVAGTNPAFFHQVTTDSRALGQGDVFVALHGERMNGHEYIDNAVENGAAAVVIDQEQEQYHPDVTYVQVEDTLTALGDLAHYRRKLLGDDLQVIAITGSSGKTTVKEMAARIFEHHFNCGPWAETKLLKTQGNYNNLIGLPLSLLPLSAAHEVAILEMGMSTPGEIARLTQIAAPDIGCINNVQPAHLLGLGSIEGVAAAKGELFAEMGEDGIKVVNYDDPHIRKIVRKDKGQLLGFAATPAGRKYKPAVTATRILEQGQQGTRFTLTLFGHVKARVHLRVPGAHNVSNALAAAAIASAAGVPLTDIVAGLEAYEAFDQRLTPVTLSSGLQVMNDTYNANPASMAAALQTVASFDRDTPAGKRVAVLGDMLELGDAAEAAHRHIGELAAGYGYDMLAVTGEYGATVAQGAVERGMAQDNIYIFKDTSSIASWLFHLITNGVLTAEDWVLLKGSRGMRMEKTVDELERLLTS